MKEHWSTIGTNEGTLKHCQDEWTREGEPSGVFNPLIIA